jgi:hypothetical protein
MAIIRDNRGAQLASNLSTYLAAAANTAGTPLDTVQISRIVNGFLPIDERLMPVRNRIPIGVYKRFDDSDRIVNRTQIVTTGIWSGDTGSLATGYTSSAQVASDSGKYYLAVYNKNPQADTSAEVQFSITYGDISGWGAPDLSVDDNSLMSTRAIYGQYRNVLLAPTDGFFSVYSGSTSAAHNLNSFFAVNINRARYRERLDPGNFSVRLTGNMGTVTLIDDSRGTDENVVTAGRVFNLVSGSLNIGSALTASIRSYTASNGQGYGLYYPDMGVILLNPDALRVMVDSRINRAPGFSAAGTYYIQNAASGAMRILTAAAGQDFQLRRTENVSTSHYFIRANNREYNFSNNPTFITGSTGQFVWGTFEKDPHVYITSVGLYNDANELLAVAKISRPIEKTFDKEVAIKVKLDF